MSALYLLRFDDISPVMNWRVWREVEAVIDSAEIKPILAVVPDLQDQELRVDAADETFWNRVRYWQARGWTIGLHGYQHRYLTDHPGIIGRNRYSEFAGLSRAQQEIKLASAIAIFRSEGVKPDIWIAPAHSFDDITVELLAERRIHYISDGFSILPHVDAQGLMWIPQQIGNFWRMPVGVWTVCMHINSWSSGQLQNFRRDICRYKHQITTFQAVAERYSSRRPTHIDRLFSTVIGGGAKLKRRMESSFQ